METDFFLRVHPWHEVEMAKDPICGMQVSESTSFTSDHMGQKFYFCSQNCKNTFDKDPMKYMGGHQTSMGHH